MKIKSHKLDQKTHTNIITIINFDIENLNNSSLVYHLIWSKTLVERLEKSRKNNLETAQSRRKKQLLRYILVNLCTYYLVKQVLFLSSYCSNFNQKYLSITYIA